MGGVPEATEHVDTIGENYGAALEDDRWNRIVAQVGHYEHLWIK